MQGHNNGESNSGSFRQVWSWLPTVYMAEAIPYVVINTLTSLIYTKLDVDNATMTFWTGWLYLPWVIKPFWSPFVDIFSTKRKWVIIMQFLMGCCFAASALLLSGTYFLISTIIVFFLAAFLSATHDIAADGYYMLQLSDHKQAEYVGWRSTFYRLGSLFASGGLVWVAGVVEEYLAKDTSAIGKAEILYSWQAVLWTVAVLLVALSIYHNFFMPVAKRDTRRITRTVKQVFNELGQTFSTFFTKKGVWTAILFMLLYRLPEALCIKLVLPFLTASRDAGGLQLSTKAVGFANGINGVIALLLGGILGGIVISRGGLKKWLWPMAMSLALPCALYCLLAYFQPQPDMMGLILINLAIGVEQFGYGFGFTAFMLYLIYFSEGRWKTSHYAFCTGIMALGMMVPGMFAGKIFEMFDNINILNLPTSQGYCNFFLFVVLCSVFTCIACLLVKIDPNFGKKAK